MNIILTRPDFGHNTFYITRKMENTSRHKSGDPFPNPLPEWVVRWGCTARIPNGPKILNKIKAIQETTNKGMFRKKVADAGHGPNTWTDVFDWFIDTMGVGKYIVRPHFHQRSEQLFFCSSPQQLKEAVEKLGRENYYISEYIEKTREWRVFVAQGRVMIVAEKLPKDRNEITWGCVEDGELDYQFWSDWNMDLVKCAIESFNLSQLDFAAIDIMEKDGKFYFLEANTAPEVWKYYGECFAKVFSFIIKNNNRERIPVVKYDDWKDCIHPAISDKAKVR